MNADAMNNTSRTDWARIDAISDEDIDTSDIPPLSEEFFANAQLRIPKLPIKVSVHVDPETFAWFQAQGESAQQQMSILKQSCSTSLGGLSGFCHLYRAGRT